MMLKKKLAQIPKTLFSSFLSVMIMFYLVLAPLNVSASENNFEILLVSLKINFHETGLISSVLKTPQNDILVPIADLEEIQILKEYLEQAKATVDNVEYTNISKLPLIDYKLQYDALVLEINFPPNAMPTQHLDAWADESLEQEGYRGLPVSAFFLNYDLTFSHQPKEFYVAGVEDLNYSTGDSFLTQSVFTRQNFSGHNTTHVVRLDSNWTSDNEDKAAQLRIGDSITTPAEWSSSTRFAGIQYATDFSIKPNLITYPLVNFSGRADLPSALDIYANSRLVYRSELNTGAFNLNDLPVTAGQGAIEVKQQDITGKLQTISIPYYIAPNLLKEGLSSFSYGIGTQRMNYGVRNANYRYLATSFDYNKGITNDWTVGGHFESLKDIFAVGTTHLYQVGNFGVISGSIATSGPKVSNAQKFMLGYSFQSQSFDVGIQNNWAGKNFYNTFNLDTSGIARSTQLSVGYNLTDTSSIGVNHLKARVRSVNDPSTSTSLLSAYYQNNLTRSTSIRISAGRDFANKHNTFAILSVASNLGSNYFSSTINRQRKDTTGQFSVNSLSSDYNGTSYRGTLNRNKKWYYDASVNFALPKANATVFLFDYGTGAIKQLELQGSVTASQGSIFLSQPINGSFAMVKLDKIKNVDVYYNNHFITKTDKNGAAFIPNIIPYVDSKISLDEKTLPLNASFVDTMAIVSPKRRAGVLADFRIDKSKTIEMVLNHQDGSHVAFDTTVLIDNTDGQDIFVAYDGKASFKDSLERKTIEGKACKKEECCFFKGEVPEDDSNLGIVDVGVLECHK